MSSDWYDNIDIISNIEKNNFQKTKINIFEEHYNLHDSNIVDIKSFGQRDIILIILFDPVWNNEFEKYKTEAVQRWPILLLYFTRVKKFEIDFILESDNPFGISKMETNNINNNILVETILHSHYGDVMKIIHSGDLEALLFDANENIIKLSKL